MIPSTDFPARLVAAARFATATYLITDEHEGRVCARSAAGDAVLSIDREPAIAAFISAEAGALAIHTPITGIA